MLDIQLHQVVFSNDTVKQLVFIILETLNHIKSF